jgi:8-oxo-dGTP diphosphatase
MIHLVRHAHAGVKSEWNGDDRIRPISERGHREVAGLLAALSRPKEITAIVSSPLLRCLQTMEPLANELGLQIITKKWLIVGSDIREVEQQLRRLDNGAVVCTHGEVIGPLITRLDAKGIPLDGPIEWPKGSIWHLRTKKRKIVAGRFERPDPTAIDG